MAVLTDEQRRRVWANVMRELSALGIDPGVLKPQLRTVLNALDQGLSDNQAAINGWIPQPERGATPVVVKAICFREIVTERYIEGVN